MLYREEPKLESEQTEGRGLTSLAIAEVFDSLQGEGEHSGRRMIFIRLAGCNVGKKINDTPYEQCQSITGAKFTCDTNYRRTQRLTILELLDRVPDEVEHVSITGGEPLIQNIRPLCDALIQKGKMVHIETSGTVKPEWLGDMNHDRAATSWIWLTVSPKAGAITEVIEAAHQIKLLVDENFDEDTIPAAVLQHRNVFVSPINEIAGLDYKTNDIAMRLVMKHPNWRLTTQMHKIWNVR